MNNQMQAAFYNARKRKVEQLRGNPPIALSNFNPPNGTISVPYTYDASNCFTGGAVVTYALVGVLPTNINLNTSSGLISGTPNTEETKIDIRITGTNADGSSTTIKADIEIVA